jgi:hypothetical protein
VLSVVIPNTLDDWTTVIASTSCGRSTVAASVVAEAIEEWKARTGELGTLIAILFLLANNRPFSRYYHTYSATGVASSAGITSSAVSSTASGVIVSSIVLVLGC